ncbi:MAG: TIGR01458 family HAD-type hydrolase [Nitrospirota bacterium]|jgi:HAD superfamily hydrolase (TIGR01458 family)
MIRGVLLDLSGVLYQGDHALPGAVAAVERLRAAGLPIRFITNVTRKGSHGVLRHLGGMGFEIPPDDLLSAPIAARRYLEQRGLHPYLLVHPALEDEFADLISDAPDAVLVGDAADGFTYAALNRAFRLLIDGAPLLAMGNNRYFREDDGLSLDIGPFVAALEYASGATATVLGKPAPAFFHAALESLDCEPEETVMVGDDALADVDGALAGGCQGILVQTGKYRPGDEEQITRPGAVLVPDIAAAVDWILPHSSRAAL